MVGTRTAGVLVLCLILIGCGIPPGPNLVETEDGWVPAAGYTWAYPDDPNNYDVVSESYAYVPEPSYEPTYQPEPSYEPAYVPEPTYQPEPAPVEPTPSPFEQEYVPGLYDPEVVINNATGETIYVSLQGPATRDLALPPGGSETVTVPAGTYYYQGTCPGVIPTSGTDSFESDYRYSWTFIIVNVPE